MRNELLEAAKRAESEIDRRVDQMLRNRARVLSWRKKWFRVFGRMPG